MMGVRIVRLVEDCAVTQGECLEPLRTVAPGQLSREPQQGAMVCAIGWYSKARGGLVPSPTWAGNPRLIEGDVNELVHTLGATARRRLLLGAAAALASGGLVAAFVSYWQDE